MSLHHLNTLEYPEVVVFEPRPKTIEEKIVKELGADFLAIAECESSIRQFKEDGSVLVSPTSDRGIFQINQVHFDTAEDLGIDVDTVEGNIAYAKFLKEGSGKQPWYMSEDCWKPILALNK